MTYLYRARHKTVYGYSVPVTLSHHLARLKPRATPYQRVVQSGVVMTPDPSFRQDITDAFGNTATFLIDETPHREMTITSDFTVDITPPVYPAPDATPTWEETRALLAAPTTPELAQAAQMTAPSLFVPRSPEAKAYAAKSFTPNRHRVPAFFRRRRALCQRLYPHPPFGERGTNGRNRNDRGRRVARVVFGVCAVIRLGGSGSDE